MPRRTLKQLRLEHAWKCASDAKEAMGAQYDGYTNAVKNLPGQITGNGLGQALAYLAAEGLGNEGEIQKPDGYLYRHMESWLTDRAELGDTNAPKGSYSEPPDGESNTASTKLIYRIAMSSCRHYRRGTAEALDYLAVLRYVAGAVKTGPFEASSDEVPDGEAKTDATDESSSPETPAS